MDTVRAPIPSHRDSNQDIDPRSILPVHVPTTEDSGLSISDGQERCPTHFSCLSSRQYQISSRAVPNVVGS